MDLMSLPQQQQMQQLAQTHHPPIHHGHLRHLQTPELMSSDGNSVVALDSNSDFARSSFDHAIALEAMQATNHSFTRPINQVSAYLCINLDSSQQQQQQLQKQQSSQHSFLNTTKTDLNNTMRPNAQVAGPNQVTIPITVPASLLAPLPSGNFATSASSSTLSTSSLLPLPPKTPTFASLNEHSSWLDQWFSSENLQKHHRSNSMGVMSTPTYKYDTDETRNHAHVMECLSRLPTSNQSLHTGSSTPMYFSKSGEHVKEENTSHRFEDEWIFPQASTLLLDSNNSTTDGNMESWKDTATFKEEDVFTELSPLSRPRMLPRMEDAERRMSTSSSQGTKRSFTADFDALECGTSGYPTKRKFVRGRQNDLDDPSTRLARYPTEFDRDVEPSYTITKEMQLEPRASDASHNLVPYPGIGDDGERLLQKSNKPDDCDMDENIVHQDPLRSDDLYTPLWTRYEGDARQGWCRFCPADQHNNWYSIKRSQYMYHLQYCHGISSRTRRPYNCPQKLMIFNDRNRTSAGLCGDCDEWVSICYGSTRKISWTAWFKHAHKCQTS